MQPVVILAAGRGDRMGGPKGLVPVGAAQVPLILWQIARLRAIGVAAVVVVVGPEADRYGACLAGTAPFVQMILSPRPELGPFSSLQSALAWLRAAWAAVPDDAGRRPTSDGQAAPSLSALDGVFVLPVDVPAAAGATWAALSAAFAREPSADAITPRQGGRGGHPVLLAPDMIARLLALAPESAEARLDTQLRRARVARVEVSDATVGADLNTPADFARFPWDC